LGACRSGAQLPWEELPVASGGGADDGGLGLGLGLGLGSGSGSGSGSGLESGSGLRSGRGATAGPAAEGSVEVVGEARRSGAADADEAAARAVASLSLDPPAAANLLWAWARWHGLEGPSPRSAPDLSMCCLRISGWSMPSR
jgi:hypothetical protein